MIIPPPNLDFSRSSNSGIALGCLSEERIICLFFSYNELKIWKNSCWDLFFPEKNCTSSIINTSMGDRLALKDSILLLLIAVTILEINFSEETYFTLFLELLAILFPMAWIKWVFPKPTPP